MLRKVILDIKTIRKPLMVMAIICFLMLPAVNYYQMRDFPMHLTLGSVLSQAQLILPLASSIPIAFLLWYYMQSGCSEVIHSQAAMQQAGPWSILILELLLQLYSVPVFLWYWHTCGVFLWPELLRTVVQAFFLQNLAYAAVYLTHSHMAGLAVQVLVAGVMQLVLMNQTGENNLFCTLNIYAKLTTEHPRPWEPLRLSLTALCGVGLWLVGKRKTSFFMDGGSL